MDDAAAAKIAEEALLQTHINYQIDRATSIRQAYELMSLRNHDVILSDLRLPDAVGLVAIAKIRSKCDTVPLIILSGSENEQFYVETLAKGADDCICRENLTPTNLLRCINQNIERVRQKRENIELMDAVDRQRQRLEEQASLLQEKNVRLASLCESARSFVNNVSHEFRTPLCVIKQYSGMLSRGTIGEMAGPQKRLLEVIEDRVDGLNSLVDDMLDVSRLESGMLAASRSRCSISEIIRKELIPLKHRGRVRSIDIIAECPNGLPEVFCDSEKVGRILVNLIVNAIKVSPPNELIRVSVSRNDPRQELDIRVSDNGPGIDEEMKGKLGRQFVRGPSSILCSEKSFGLGLSITKELVNLNLGSLKIESQVGIGSSFSFTVPYANPKAILNRYFERLMRHTNQSETKIAVLRASIESANEEQRVDDVERFLSYSLRARDIVIPIQPNVWLLVLNIVADEMPRFRQRFEVSLSEVNRNRPQGDLPAIDLQQMGLFDRVTEVDDIEFCLSKLLLSSGAPGERREGTKQYV
ncbi:response regulator receiver sensor signal transduction histidine kinase [Rhodopirellula baltica SWK14]|uniref:histidine kinase n=1 Tax=Rhodopirellula baltica SWK14 TaxID=993516 RepID=L7CMV3_RHOBT|nr:response regulator receiver sensor signal transduction histidine kinase [Rhodopirellula baltica SWK14]